LSKAFDLIQQVEQERQGYLASAVAPAIVPRNGNGVRKHVVDAEEITRLVQRLFRTPETTVAGVVVFSSVEAGSGCTSICAATAETLAGLAPGSFCVVDANLRNPSLHHYFGLENRIGLVDAIVQPGPIQSFAQRVAGTNLWVLPSGVVKLDPNALLHSEVLQARLGELRASFNHVLIDTPPLNRCGDALLVGRASDGLLLVLESNATRKQAARNAAESLKSSNVRVLGAVLNKRTYPIPDKLYHRL
jgi:capsular exopolysaccharide synthesis family protein